MVRVSVERIINAPLEKVWAAAGDFTKSPDPSLPVTIVNRGDASNFGIGCERRITAGKRIVCERVTAVDPPNSLTYTMLSGAPVKNYTGKVELKAAEGSTIVRWSAEFSPSVPGTGWIIKAIMGKNFNTFIDEFEKIK